MEKIIIMNLLKSINIKPYIFDILTKLLSLVNKKNIKLIKLNDSQLNNSLNMICFRDIILAYDIEFQNYIYNKPNYIINNTILFNNIMLPRELGILIFIKDYQTKEWYYITDILINFPIYKQIKKISLITSKYSTITDKNIKMMEKNELIFMDDFFIELYLTKLNRLDKLDYFLNNKQQMLFEIVYDLLPNNYKKYFIKQLNIYTNDSLVKKRILSKNKSIQFMKLFSSLLKYSVCVVKGSNDINSLINLCQIYNIDSTNFKQIIKYDIEIFNGLSKKLYGDAKLYTTFSNLKNSQYYINNLHELQFIFDSISNKEHNPVFDSIMTLIISLIINIILFNYLDNTTQFGGKYKLKFIDYVYFNKYKQLKNIYLETKNSN